MAIKSEKLEQIKNSANKEKLFDEINQINVLHFLETQKLDNFNNTKPNLLNSINGRLFKIQGINSNSFYIGDTTDFEPYVRNGTAKNIKQPFKIDFNTLQECLTT